VRSIAADDFWASPMSGRPTIAIHFTWKGGVQPLLEGTVLPALEAALLPLDYRAHLGKLCVDSRFSTYPHAGSFLRLRDDFDPHHKFSNDMLNSLFSKCRSRL